MAEGMAAMCDRPEEARHAPATLRNREPIASALRAVLPARGTVLEIASGSGEHAVHFAAAFPDLTWQPSDPDPDARASIAAHRRAAGLRNLLGPLALDASSATWPVETTDAVVSINMIHISPIGAMHGLLAGAARCLPPGGVLFLYGPFIEPDLPLAPSNAAFDADLRRRDPAWGLRHLDTVTTAAAKQGLTLEARHEMPANNLGLVFRKTHQQIDRRSPMASS